MDNIILIFEFSLLRDKDPLKSITKETFNSIEDLKENIGNLVASDTQICNIFKYTYDNLFDKLKTYYSAKKFLIINLNHTQWKITTDIFHILKKKKKSQ
ncbi:MAG: hypothetical protein GF317_09830 [Candidatus Lokiarchaeota archaeon]|nr:hypothetical protein [Candidatus Lokiarchaeota archaeon]